MTLKRSSKNNNFAEVQSRVLEIMGPLGKLWTFMDTARLDDSEEIHLFEALELVEKIITLVGQTFGSLYKCIVYHDQVYEGQGLTQAT